MCEVLFQKTYALGRTDCETSFSELASLTGLTMRQCFNIMSQLEALKFIERQPTAGGGNRKGQGSRIIFYLFPKN
jgi:MarR-like DNA-binding transcriptional regulator SgrR of sgrS sRNA